MTEPTAPQLYDCSADVEADYPAPAEPRTAIARVRPVACRRHRKP